MSEDCLKLTVHFGERERDRHRFLASWLIDLYARHRIATSVLLRGIEGFGGAQHVRTDRLLSLSEDLPLATVAVDTRERIETLLPELRGRVPRGLVTIERARLLTDAAALADQAPAVLAPHEEAKLTVYLGRRERADGEPAFAAVVALLHRHGVAGATVLLGVDGTVHGERRQAGFLGRNADVPLMIIAVGSSAAIGAALPELARILRRPLVTLERVRVCKRDGARLAEPAFAGAADAGLWNKLMVYASEQSTHAGRPLQRELIRRLRADGGSGATAVRGIWGYHGDHAPHGERLVALTRHAPVVTTIVERPEHAARTFAIVDELTSETGLVTSELARPWAEAGA